MVSVPDVNARAIGTWETGTQVIIDGYEQLVWWRRCWLEKQCRRQRVGLVITAHRPMGLPALLSTSVTPVIAQRIVAQLLAQQRHTGARSINISTTAFFSLDRIAHLLTRHHGNMRETLFSMYDLYEQMCRS